MNKIVMIGGREYTLTANGSTPRIYRAMFNGKDVFSGISSAVSSAGELKDIEVIENLAYCMAIQGGSIPSDMSIDAWLESFDSPLAVIEAAPKILEFWGEETNTTSIGKKE